MTAIATEDRHWLQKYKSEFESELDKLVNKIETETGTKPHVELEYKVILKIKPKIKLISDNPDIPPYHVYAPSLNINTTNSTKGRKPHLAAKQMLRPFLNTLHLKVTDIPPLWARLSHALYVNEASKYGKISNYYTEVQKNNALHPPTPLEQFFHPTLSNKLKKELAKI